MSRGLPELTGAPAVARLKSYSSQSGYVYQYYFRGHRPLRAGRDSEVEYVFSVTSERKSFRPVSVRLSEGAIARWQQENARELSTAERYAVAKIALFQAFDECASPAELYSEIRVRNHDLDLIVQTLDL